MNDQPAPSREERPPSLVRVASDELLLLGARLHDDVALGVLYDRYGTEVYAAAYDALRQADAAEAAMQDVFLRIWRGVELYDASYGTTHDWLIGIARNRALDALSRLEPFGGVPERLVGLGDSGLLAPPEPASGARDRLLARARAESSGVREADAPTVVLPFAELGADVDRPLSLEPAPVDESTSAPTLASESEPDAEPAPTAAASSEAENASDGALTTGVEPAADAEPTIDAASAAVGTATSETGIVSEAATAAETEAPSEAVTAAETEVVSEAPTAAEIEVLADAPTTSATELPSEDRPTLESSLAHDEPPTLEVELAPEERPPLEAETVLAHDERPTADVELASEAPTLTGLTILGPRTPNGQYAIVPDQADTHHAVEPDEVATPHAELPEEPVTQDVILAEVAVTQDVAMTTDAAEPAEERPPARNLTELPPSEALAVALAPIPPRRPQQPHRAAPEAPRQRGIKLATIGWGAALLFVVASGLAVATWSATGPHVSPDLNVMSRLPGGRIITLRGTGAPTASARLHSVDSGRRSELSVESLPPLPAGRVYQVWLIEPNQQARSAGAFLINRRGDAVIPVNLGGPVERLQAIAITQEAAPGAPAPTGPRVLEGTP